MTYIQDVTREALQTASSDIMKSRRTLLLVAGILALVHVLTVYPYLETSKEITQVEQEIANNATVLARLEPEIERLRDAGTGAHSNLSGLLDGVTEEMIARFAGLRGFVERAFRGDLGPFDASPPDSVIDLQIQQMGPNMIPQAQIQQMGPPSPAQFPPEPLLPGQSAPPIFSAPPIELRPILEALVSDEQDAYDRLIDYARSDIVAPAYARAAREWSQTIRPGYLEALDTTSERTMQAAESALQSAPEIASSLKKAAEDMTRQRTAIEAIEIRHDEMVDEALGTDWWRTVEGKGAYADAVGDSIRAQMKEISDAAAAPVDAIRNALALQEELQKALKTRQSDLEKEFAAQRDQLAALSGASGIIPVNLATFIGVFPLVLGLALGFVMLRTGQARRQAAIAAEDLARYAPNEDETVNWLSRRALGGGSALGPLLLISVLAIVALAWIGLAATQVSNSVMEPPLAAWRSGGIAALVIAVAAVWDGVAITRLAAILKRRKEADAR